MKSTNIRDATHIKVQGVYKKIVEKWGVSPEGRLAKPSEGGFGVVTEDGERIDMWHAEAYGVED